MRNDVYIFNHIKFSEIIKERADLIKRHVLNNFN